MVYLLQIRLNIAFRFLSGGWAEWAIAHQGFGRIVNSMLQMLGAIGITLEPRLLITVPIDKILSVKNVRGAWVSMDFT